MAFSPRLNAFLEASEDLLVVLGPGTSRSTIASLGLPESSKSALLVEPMPPPRDYDAIVLAVRDLVTFRKAVTGLGNYGKARVVALHLDCEPAALAGVTPRSDWPALIQIVARRTPDHFILLEFAEVVAARPVLLELARGRSPSSKLDPAWPLLGALRDQPSSWPVAAPGTVVAYPRRLFDASVDSPPDLVLTSTETAAPDSFTHEHPVLGRPPNIHVVEPDLSWEALADLDEREAASALEKRGPLSLGGIDEKVFNPIGFDRRPVGSPANTDPGRSPDSLSIRDESNSPIVEIDGRHGVSDADLATLRRLPGVKLNWAGGPGPQAYARIVATLAMAGIPLLSHDTPLWADALLSPPLLRALSTPANVEDRLAREEHSIRLRRAALHTHATVPWRRMLAEQHGLQHPPGTRVSVLLATRRPEMLPFALRQLARQRGADFEVILAPHGFDADASVLSSFEEQCSAPLSLVPSPGDTLFGDVLNEAASRASGDVLLKMDDDDWYGPDFISDLLLARNYSSAETVGCPPEFTYVEPLSLTTRRAGDTEVYRPFVAGGTMLIDRGAFRSLGGFRRTKKYVDANLLAALINAGGHVYRTHGLGYVLRRGPLGHTWDPGLGYFVTKERAPEQWRGFRPSALLEAAPEDYPHHSRG